MDVKSLPPGRLAPRRRSLRWGLPLIVAGVIIVVFAALVAGAYLQMQRALMETARARAQAAAHDLVGLLAPNAQQRAAEMAQVASAPSIVRALVEGTAEARTAALAMLRSRFTAGRQAIELWHRDGTAVLSLVTPGAENAFPPPAPPQAAGLRLTRFEGQVLGDFIEPVPDPAGEASAIGFLVLRRPISLSTPDVLSKLVGNDARVRVGTYAGTWTDAESLFSASPVELAGVGVGEYTTADGERRVAAVAAVAGTHWLASVSFPLSAFMEPARAFLYRTTATALVLVLIAAIGIRVVTSRITGAVIELTDASEALAAGDFSRRVSTTRSDEIGRLGQSFNSMVTQLEHAHGRLLVARDEAVAQARRAQFTAAVALALTEDAELQTMLDRCARAMVDHLGVARARIWTLSESALELQADAGNDAAGGDELRRLSLPVDRPAEVAVARIADDPRLQANVVVPLTIENRLHGVIAFIARDPLPSEAIVAIESAARTISLAVDRRRLFDSRSRYEELLESATDFVTIGTTSGPPIYINRAARMAFGIGPDEEVKTLFDFRPDEFRAHFEQTILPSVLRDGFWQGRTEYRSRTGRLIPVSQVSIAQSDAAGKVRFVSTISRDISEELERERERELLEDQLRRAQRIEAVGQLAGGLAHDFNNLLTIILGYANLLGDQIGESDSRRENLDAIQGAGNRAAQLTRQLLAFSRQQVLSPVVLNPNTLIDGVRGMLTRLAGDMVEVLVAFDPQASAIKIDPTQLELVLVNLVVNARDAMPGGGQLRIETANVTLDEEFCRTHLAVAPGRYVRISVTDTGTGIDEETRKRVFEPFFTTKGRDKGTGLGLATVFGIVKQSGGSVWVYSEPGKGASFKIFLPVADEAVEHPPEARTVAQPRGSETILLVEDEPNVRHLVETVLRRAGYQVLAAMHSAEAIDIASRPDSRIDLLLTDVMMPDMNGAALAREIEARRPGLRTIFMSGFSDQAIQHHGVLAGGNIFLQKPFTASDLTRAVRQALDSSQ